MSGDARVPRPVKGGCQTVSVGAASARTAAGVGDQIHQVLIYSSTDAHYAIGDATVTATTADTFIRAGGEQFVRVGNNEYVAFIQASAGGAAAVSAMTY